MAEAARLTIFDLDGVLLEGDTMASLVLHRLRSSPLRAVPVAGLFAATAFCSPTGRRRAALHRSIVRVALAGISEPDYRELAGLTGRRLAARADTRCVELARRALAAGGTVVVSTASERTLARSFLDEAGLESAVLFASEVCFTGRSPTLSPHNVGRMKVHSFRAAGLEPRGAVLYTDSLSDLPLARLAARTVLVDPDRRSRRLYPRLLSTSAPLEAHPAVSAHEHL